MVQTTSTASAGVHALAKTVWADLPRTTLEDVVRGAVVRRIPARGTIFGLGDPKPRAGILLGGTARAFLAAVDGRQLTVRYARRGALIGRRSDVLGGHTPVAIHAVTDVEILDLDAHRFVRLLEREPAVARTVLVELGRRLEDVYATVADSAFGTVRERVARHLLALTDGLDADGRRRTAITQQELADGVGTMREVVARALREFREQGLIATEPGLIEVLDADRLAASLGGWQRAAAGPSSTSGHDIEAILEANPNAIIAVKPDGSIRYVNALAEALFGSTRGEMVGRKVETLIPEEVRDRHVAYRADFLADPVTRPVTQRQGLFARRLDGTLFPVSVGIARVDTFAGVLILATIVERLAG